VTAAGVWVVYVGWGLGLVCVCVLCCYSAVFLRIISFVFCLILFSPFLPGRAKKRKSSPPPFNFTVANRNVKREREKREKEFRIVFFLLLLVFSLSTSLKGKHIKERTRPSVDFQTVCVRPSVRPSAAYLFNSRCWPDSIPLPLPSLFLAAHYCACVCVEQATTIHLTQSHTNNNKVTERRTAVKIEIETENLFKTLTGGKGGPLRPLV
jgi:hypothetical protein